MAERSIAAYFYPHAPLDHGLLQRAKANGIRVVKNEVYGSRRAIDKEGRITTWSDRDPLAIARQIQLAQEYGIDAFIVDAYAGADNGVRKTELHAPLDTIAQVSREHDFKFALMCSIKRPPTLIPYPNDNKHQETGRHFDFTGQTLDLIVDHAAQYWNNSNYLQVRGRPFVGIYGLTPQIIEEFRNQNILNIGHTLRYMSRNKCKVAPFFVAVAQSPILAYEFVEQGFDATTTYAGLADYYDSVRQSPLFPVINWDSISIFQHYEEQLAREMLFWQSLLLRQGLKFYPSAVAGWDPIRRCEPNVDPAHAMPGYPYRPRITDSTPAKFFGMLLAVNNYYAHARLPSDDDDFPYIVATWNDVGDGTDILPRITEGRVDLGYLEAVKRLKHIFDIERYVKEHEHDLYK